MICANKPIKRDRAEKQEFCEGLGHPYKHIKLENPNGPYVANLVKCTGCGMTYEVSRAYVSEGKFK